MSVGEVVNYLFRRKLEVLFAEASERSGRAEIELHHQVGQRDARFGHAVEQVLRLALREPPSGGHAELPFERFVERGAAHVGDRGQFVDARHAGVVLGDERLEVSRAKARRWGGTARPAPRACRTSGR